MAQLYRLWYSCAMFVTTYRKQLRERALDNYGFITTEDAVQLGIPPAELTKLASRGGLTHLAYGLYRVDDTPSTVYDEFAQAVLRVGQDAYLTHDTVLALHNLALVNPRYIKVGTPHRVRTKLPERIKVVRRNLPAEKLTVYEGIPSTTVAQALLDCRDIVMHDRLMEAIDEASTNGLVVRRDQDEIRAALEVDVR